MRSTNQILVWDKTQREISIRNIYIWYFLLKQENAIAIRGVNKIPKSFVALFIYFLKDNKDKLFLCTILKRKSYKWFSKIDFILQKPTHSKQISDVTCSLSTCLKFSYCLISSLSCNNDSDKLNTKIFTRAGKEQS